MRSSKPMPGNPWPHDMVLTIDDDDQGLLELLWVREAWGLAPEGDVPPPAELLPACDPSGAALPDGKRALEQSWIELWSAVLAHSGAARDPGVFEAVQSAPLGSQERQDLLDRLFGPSCRDRFGDAAFDDRFERWVRDLGDLSRASTRLPLEQHPERRCLAALIPAWERGLTTIVVLPCSGEHTRTVGSSGLCVTRATRLDPGRYTQALASFLR